MHITSPLMPPIRETAAATACRLRRRLADLYPKSKFKVSTRRGQSAAELVVEWTGSPTVPEVLEHVEPFARRTARGVPLDPTLWVNDEGKVALVYPGADRVRLQNHPTVQPSE